MRFRRRRALLAGITLVLCAGLAARLLGGRTANDPLLSARPLGLAPWSAALDEETGTLLIVNRSVGGAGYAFASAGSYSFAVNGKIGSSLSNSSPARNPDTISLLGVDDGSAVRSAPVGGDPGAVAIDPQQDRMYVTSEDDDSVSVLDAHRATRLATIRVGTRPTALAVSGPTARAFVVNAGDGTVSVVDVRGDRMLRAIAVPAAVDAASAAVDSRVQRVFVAAPGVISILDARTGVLLKTLALRSSGTSCAPQTAPSRPVTMPPMTSMAVDQTADRVYVLAAGALTVVDAGRARVLRCISGEGDATALGVDTRDGHLFLARMGRAGVSGTIEGAGSLDVRDARTGVLLRSISLGLAPIAVAVDERRDRLIVVDSGGNRGASNRWTWLPNGLRRWLPFVSGAGTSAHVEPARVEVLNLAKL